MTNTSNDRSQIPASFLHIPDTISDQAAAMLRVFPDPVLMPKVPSSDDCAAWKLTQQAMDIYSQNQHQVLVENLRPQLRDLNVGGVPVLEVKNRNWQTRSQARLQHILVYIHGGAYTLMSARSSLANAALLAEATGLTVLSIDYTLAPHAKWQQITDQVVSVFQALNASGVKLSNIGIAGDSAGGALAAGSVLKMRDQGLGMPAAVVLWSPWSDITESGDSYQTLRTAEAMYTYKHFLKPSADAYADPEEQKHPYVSPVYGDYSLGFPPTLIQGGTKEIFLSNFIRHYQALDNAGQKVKLDLYEGMPHVFQSILAGTKESSIALGKVNIFLEKIFSNMHAT